MPDIWAGVNWNCFISVKLPSNIHLRCFWTRETLQKDCLSQGHMVHLKSSPPACPEGEKKSKKELDRHLTLNKYPAGNTFLVRVNSPIKKTTKQTKIPPSERTIPPTILGLGLLKQAVPCRALWKNLLLASKACWIWRTILYKQPQNFYAQPQLRAKTPLY